MTEKQVNDKLRSLEREIDVLEIYKQEIINEIGRKLYDEEINERLSQYKFYLIILKTMGYEKKD